MSDREAFLLRTNPKVLDAIRRWARDDLRSVNAQIEYLLREAVRKCRRKVGDESRRNAPDG